MKNKAILLRAQALLGSATNGDGAARTKADAYLKKHNLSEEEVPPWRGFLDDAEREAIEQAQQDKTATRSQTDAYFQEQALITLCGESGLPERRHFKRWPWLLEFAANEKAYVHKAVLSLLGVYSGVDDAAMHIFTDRLEELKPSAHEAKKLLGEWDQARLEVREVYGPSRYSKPLRQVLRKELRIKLTKRSRSEVGQSVKRSEEDPERRLEKLKPIGSSVRQIIVCMRMLDEHKISILQKDGKVVATT